MIWLSLDCVTTTNTYLKAKADLPKVKTATDATVAKLDADIVKQIAQDEKADKLIPEYQAKIESYTVIVAALKADTVNLVKNKKAIDSYNSAIRNYNAAIAAYTTVGKQSDRSKKAREQAVNQYENSKKFIATSLSMAKLICTNGF